MQTAPRLVSRQVRLLVSGVVGLTTIVLVFFADQIPWSDWPQLFLLLLTIAIGFSFRIPNPRGGAVTPSSVLSYLAIYLLNPPTALLVVGIGRTIGYVLSKGWIPWRALLNGCQIALSVALGSAVYQLLGGTPGRFELSSVYPALVAGPLVHQVTNNFFAACVFSRWRGTPLFSTWLGGVYDLLWPNLLSIPTAILLATLYVNLHYTAVIAYLALLPFQWRALHLYMKRRQLHAQIVDGLVVATDVNFPLGRGHARRVADLSVAIAREMRLSESTVESVQFAALLHDVGMIGKDDVLDRPVLTAEDAENLLDHVHVGAKMARELPRKEIAEAILYHHERFDGTGYPGGLSGEAITLPARIIALAEAADSMAFGIFPYPSASSLSTITSYVSGERGKAFDPEVVDAFLKVVELGTVALDEGAAHRTAPSVSSEFGGLPVG